MNSIGERIKRIREMLGSDDKPLSQAKFADKINLGSTAISNIEAGIRNPSERTIIDICREYNVNERWLRFGEGDEIFAPVDREIEIGALLADVALDKSLRGALIRTLARLDPSDWKVLEKMLDKLLEEYQEK